MQADTVKMCQRQTTEFMEEIGSTPYKSYLYKK